MIEVGQAGRSNSELELDRAIASIPLLAAPVRVPHYGIFSVLHTLALRFTHN